jgi:O-antigen ligase
MRTLLAIAIVAVVIAGVGLSFFVLLESRLLTDPSGKAVEDRISQSHRALLSIRAHPLLGVGSKNYAKVQHLYSPLLRHVGLIQLHNTYLITAAEMGIPGLIILLWLLSSLFLQGLRNLRTNEIFLAYINIGLLAGMVARWIFWMPQPSWVGEEVIFWVLAGLVMASKRMYGQERSVPIAAE